MLGYANTVAAESTAKLMVAQTASQDVHMLNPPYLQHGGFEEEQVIGISLVHNEEGCREELAGRCRESDAPSLKRRMQWNKSNLIVISWLNCSGAPACRTLKAAQQSPVQLQCSVDSDPHPSHEGTGPL
ncbi:hypothetical protein EYF80_054728 [Liparis tanakae]|uniref:Uncharacterized protein n=1 Tax=Liparis tanakae TaxID=230148 RepID=A0A4Z2F1U7_9TELE|nr:hypothetical protein EYF80_054728 [Liparis tanakae]